MAKHPTPTALRKAGRARGETLLRKHAPRAGKRWAADVFTALDEQTVIVSGTNAAGIVLPQLARSLTQTRTAHAEVLAQVERLVEAHPLHLLLLTPLPVVGLRTEAWIHTEIIGKDFQTTGHFASFTGLAPVTWRSGTSIRGDHPSRKGNKVLKRALFRSAFASPHDPISRTYFDRKCAEGKRHNHSVIALARRRFNVLFAILRDGSI